MQLHAALTPHSRFDAVVSHAQQAPCDASHPLTCNNQADVKSPS